MDFILTKLKSRRLWLFVSPLLLFLAIDLVFPFRVKSNYSTVVMAADSTILHAFLNDDDKWRLPTELHEITPQLRQTILFKEDKYFYYHPGINPIAIMRALVRNIATGRRTSGASTITMQVVRLLQPRKRTYGNKLIEIFRALQLELHYSKDEILQLYLNLIPYGSNIEGIKSASILYLGKSPQLLSLAEMTALTIIPNRPSSLRLGQNNERIVAARNLWLKRFLDSHLFDKQSVEDAMREPLNAHRRDAPTTAPHWAIRLKNENKSEAVIYSSLNRSRQAQVELMVKNYVNRLQAMNIHNAAVLVVNNQTMAVECYVGSADFKNSYDGGQVDGIRAIRSPGSTLKPLLYGIAFDKGLITPKSMINDVPTNFGGFTPENFDRHFNGKVSIEFALANSLNIPSVKVLQELRPSVLIEYLKQADFRTIKKQAPNLGLSMILGGCGVTLEELTRLFSMFANEGEFRTLNLSPQPLFRRREGTSSSPAESEIILSPESTYLITNILTQITRPDLPNNFDNTYHLPRIAWKTGTSFGKKDAWSIGYNRQFTVGVWVGNFSGVGVPELSGANIATPLLFDIFNSIAYNSPKGWYKPTKTLGLRKICAESGDIPSDFCTHQVTDYAIMGVSHTRKCQHLKWVFTNATATTSYCTQCLPDSGYSRKLYPNLAADLISFYETKQLPYIKIPPHNAACTRVLEVGAPIIVSPNDGSEYFVEPGQQLALECQATNDVKEVYWYVNDQLIQKIGPTKTLFVSPPLGKVKISCSDDKGRNSDIFINVKN
jgi:penicillin-binding protein 1C